ncbi:MAG TPA: GDSL-type esterase/lipase family protein [Segetibacter sp.]
MAAKLFLLAAFVFSMFMMSLNYRKKKKKIVFLGDSITEQGATAGGYITRILQKLREDRIEEDYELTGAGVWGDKIYDLYLRLDDDVLAKGADVVVVYIGINDVWDKKAKGTGTEVGKFEEFYAAITEKLKAALIKVVLCTPTVIGENMAALEEFSGELDLYSDVVRKLASENEFPVIDLRKAFVAYNQANNVEDKKEGILTTDGVHLNSKGNQLVADEMWTVLQHIK